MNRPDNTPLDKTARPAPRAEAKVNDKPTEERHFTVSELNRALQRTIAEKSRVISVEAEISNLGNSRGNLYFSLKDKHSEIAAMIWRSDAQMIRTEPKNGMKVRVKGQAEFNPKRGKMTFMVKVLEDAGKGALHEQFERLKAKLQSEGLFEAGRKKRLPAYPRKIGLVTSATGAAVRDMIHVLTRRFPHLHIIVFPAKVQGEGAAQEIVSMIQLADRGSLDALIVGRGGGSLEDLWAFNEEVVARAIAACKVPIISAVGHETDTTIADFVADKRAPTPSAAAEILVPELAEVLRGVERLKRRMSQEAELRLARLQNRFQAAAKHAVLREPEIIVERFRQRLVTSQAALPRVLLDQAKELRFRVQRSQQDLVHATQSQLRFTEQKLDSLSMKLPQALIEHTKDMRYQLQSSQRELAHATETQLQATKQRLETLSEKLQTGMEKQTLQRRNRLERAQGQLRTLSPFKTLERGFSITRKPDGTIVRDPANLKPGDAIETIFAEEKKILSEVSKNQKGSTS